MVNCKGMIERPQAEVRGFGYRAAIGVMVGAALALSPVLYAQGPAPGQVQFPATLDDYFEPGTQENTLTDPLQTSWSCIYCHLFDDDGNRKEVVAPHDNWKMSLMAHAARDPVWHAALAIGNQDASFSGDTCIRCHSPMAWLSGRSVPTDASGFTPDDFDGVSCNFCHRLVDPVAQPGNPIEDDSILSALQKEGLLPSAPGNGRYVVDPADVRRGPLDDVPANFHGVPIIVSPFHTKGQLCGTCHDVSNSLYTRQLDGTYQLNTPGEAHPTLDPHEMMPEQRTYSEWLNSTFASDGVFFEDGRFGGDHPTGVMRTCQDCHMPKHYGGVCSFWSSDPFFPRLDVPEHSFIGANTWVLGAVYDLYGQAETNISPEDVDLNLVRAQTMLQNASDMQVVQYGDRIIARVVNFSGHKLPTGYPEGRRMWLNVQFFNAKQALIAERGFYDYGTADLTTGDTKVYEMKLGMTEDAAAEFGLSPGESHHLVLNNTIVKDNRIPPIGFTNAAFNAIRSPVVNHTYADGQHWDDTVFMIPEGSAEVVVTLNYQTTSKEYIEFLRDANTSKLPNDAGQIAYDAWVSRGMSAPVDMDMQAVVLGPLRFADINHDGVVGVPDLLAVINAWGACPPPELCPENLNGDSSIGTPDLLLVINNWG